MNETNMKSCEKYEKAIKEYTGNDPLDLWHKYIEAMDTEENILLPDVVSRASSLFFDELRYINDLRWYDILYRHAEIHDNPMKFYMSIYKKTKESRQPAELFVRWSKLYDENSDEHRGQIVLKQALVHNVREKDWIKKLMGSDDSKKLTIQYFPELSEISMEEVKAEKYLKNMKIQKLTDELEKLQQILNKSDTLVQTIRQNDNSTLDNIFSKPLKKDEINGCNDHEANFNGKHKKSNLAKEKPSKNFEIYTDEIVQEGPILKKEKFAIFHDESIGKDMENDNLHGNVNYCQEKNENSSIIPKTPRKYNEIESSEMFENDFEMSIIRGSHNTKEMDDDIGFNDYRRFNPNVQSTMQLHKFKNDVVKDDTSKLINKTGHLPKDLSKISEENTQSTLSSNGSRTVSSILHTKCENKTLPCLSGITEKVENNSKRNYTNHLNDQNEPIKNKKCFKDLSCSIVGGSYCKKQMEHETNDYRDFIPPIQSTAMKKSLISNDNEQFTDKENQDPEYQDQFDITIAPKIDTSHYVPDEFDEEEDDDQEDVVNDPFSTTQMEGLLNSSNAQAMLREEPEYYRLSSSIFPSHSKLITLGKIQFKKEKQLGKGAYASVFKCLNLNTKKHVAIKVCSETNAYEFFIIRTIHNRLKNKKPSNKSCIEDSIMKVHSAYYFNNGSALTTDYHEHGTLLDMINLGIKKNGMGKKPLSENLSVLITMELLSIFHYLHSVKIIHADVKADNVMIKSLKGITKCHTAKHYIEQSRCTICELIDFGRAIDKESYEDHQEFNVVVKNLQCIEMKTKKSWTYQIDLFGLLGIIHTMLFGKYMNVHYINNKWNITNTFCARIYQHSEIWNELFSTLLNIESCSNVPSLHPFITKFKKSFSSSVKWNELVSECKFLSTKLLLK